MALNNATATVPERRAFSARGAFPTWPLQIGVLVAAGCALGLMLAFGGWALAVPLYVAAFIGAVCWPRATTLAVIAMLFAIEPKTFDITQPLSLALYYGPPGMNELFPLTISPAELTIVIAFAAALARGPAIHRFQGMPVLLAAIPVLLMLGLAYGLYRGAPQNFAYHEARGLLYGILVFLLLPTLDRRAINWLGGLTLAAGLVLGITLIGRYLFFVRWGELPVAAEAAFSHDSVILLMLCGVVAGAMLFRERSAGARMQLLLVIAIMVVALMMTGRRSATLVAGVGALTFLLFMFPQRKQLVMVLSLLLVVVGSVYLGAYWNKEYGAMAQPARAVRSQIDPSARDDSSDTYRETERYNLVQTIRSNPVFGVGFGNEFYQFQPLPDLRSFWPLQVYTPHQNVMWLWLKMGILGISVLLASFALALTRCLSTAWRSPTNTLSWAAAVTAAAGLLMILSFATVDIVFPTTRAMVVFAVILSVSFQLWRIEAGEQKQP